MKQYIWLIILLKIFVLSGSLMAAEGQLIAGTAKINITPRNILPLHDSVYARSLVLEADGIRIAQVAVDLVGFESDRVAKVCKEKYGISHVLISASHSHSCPIALALFDRSKTYPSYTTFFEDRIIEVIGMALKNTFPARVSAGHRTFPQLGFNRLIIREDGRARESWFADDHYNTENPERIPFGPVDPEVGVVKIEDMSGNPKVILMNYACHSDIVCFNYEISADYPGFAARKVEEAFDNKVNCLFVQGAAGNVESLQISRRRSGPEDPVKSDYTPMVRTGELLAYEAIRLAKQLRADNDQTTINIRKDSLHFTGRYNKELSFNVHLTTILINNNILIAACPGELFVQLQLEWKNKVRLANAVPFVFGYTWTGGKSPGYIPDIRSAALGGFGADQSSHMMEVGSGEVIMNKQLENFYKLNGLMRQTPQ
ncbi:hypothetical protein [Prevotella sp. 10(H)]|uniref:hypothetical protein n=1 Tax=Prevotella sp. 10(H) TaxID=1158294 RepID=UPI0004A77890|nr:hypothetical protein [Prevotella sp. 10(H)]